MDGAASLTSALARLGYRYRVDRAGRCTRVERVFRGVIRNTTPFSNTFCHAHPQTAETWPQTFAVRRNNVNVDTIRGIGKHLKR